MAEKNDSHQSWYELPFWHLIRFVVYTAVITWLVSWLSTRFLMWDYALWNFHLANLWLIFPEGITLFGTVYIWRWDRKREQAKRQRQAQTELQRLLQQAGGGNKK